jgi:restriction endonuclease Mrr
VANAKVGVKWKLWWAREDSNFRPLPCQHGQGPSAASFKVTQASRDGGVDAIAFNPDPIRGGKTVIQAKRYSYTVGVSAVRDLYGTVMNEGASKGILVTTLDYGPDAYAFASGKPLTLLRGSSLPHLLQKHGVSAHINLAEGRQSARERFAGEHSQERREP